MLGIFRKRGTETRVEPHVSSPATPEPPGGAEMRASPIPPVRRRGKHPNLARAAIRHFEAGKQDRLTGSWGTTPLTADDIVRRHQRVLVARSREQCANNDYAR